MLRCSSRKVASSTPMSNSLLTPMAGDFIRACKLNGFPMASAAALPLDRPADPSSREKLLGAAERLFADRGFNGVSVRQIAAAAGVNSALVGYYFGSKTGLLSEVYRLHCEPMNR